MREKMKALKRTLVFTFAFLMLLFTVSCKKDISVPEGYKLASNLDRVDYMLFVPSDWIIKESSTMTSAYVSESDKTSISVIQRNKLDNEEANAQWWYDNYYMSELKNSLGEDKITEKSSEDFTLDTVAGKKFTFDIVLDGTTYNYIVVCVYTNASFYAVTYTSVGELFDKNMDDLNGILTNFKFD